MVHLNNVAEVPLAFASANLSEFLQPPLASLEHELMLEVEPILEPESLPEYIPLPELQPMSPDLPLLEPIVTKVPVIEISMSDSLTLTTEPLQVSDTFESDSLQATFTTAT